MGTVSSTLPTSSVSTSIPTWSSLAAKNARSLSVGGFQEEASINRLRVRAGYKVIEDVAPSRVRTGVPEVLVRCRFAGEMEDGRPLLEGPLGFIRDSSGIVREKGEYDLWIARHRRPNHISRWNVSVHERKAENIEQDSEDCESLTSREVARVNSRFEKRSNHSSYKPVMELPATWNTIPNEADLTDVKMNNSDDWYVGPSSAVDHTSSEDGKTIYEGIVNAPTATNNSDTSSTSSDPYSGMARKTRFASTATKKSSADCPSSSLSVSAVQDGKSSEVKPWKGEAELVRLVRGFLFAPSVRDAMLAHNAKGYNDLFEFCVPNND